MHLFLDFDGVLHPKGSGQQHFTRLPLLEEFLRKPEHFPVKLVISSTWRHAYGLSKLRTFFSPDIAARIVGVTPSLDAYAGDFERSEEIEAWLSSRNAGPWVALDDEAEHFAPSLRRRLVLCNGSLGLQEEDLSRLQESIGAQ